MKESVVMNFMSISTHGTSTCAILMCKYLQELRGGVPPAG